MNLYTLFIIQHSISVIVMFHPSLLNMYFLIHERKHAKWHQLLFKYLNKIPRLDKKKIPFVVDQEPGLKKAIQGIFPNCPIMFC